MARNLALDLAPLRVNLVSPGSTDTGLWGPNRAQMREIVAKNALLGKAGSAEEVAEAYIYLMKETNATGSCVSSNGGFLIKQNWIIFFLLATDLRAIVLRPPIQLYIVPLLPSRRHDYVFAQCQAYASSCCYEHSRRRTLHGQRKPLPSNSTIGRRRASDLVSPSSGEDGRPPTSQEPRLEASVLRSERLSLLYENSPVFE